MQDSITPELPPSEGSSGPQGSAEPESGAREGRGPQNGSEAPSRASASVEPPDTTPREPDFTSPLTGIEVRQPCPYCGDHQMIPRRQYAEHVARLHPDVREGGPGIPVPDAEPAPAGLRDQYRAAIGRGGGCVDLAAATDAVLAVRDREVGQLRAQPHHARATLTDTMTTLAEEMSRTTTAEATVARVRSECDRIETAVRANPQAPDFDGAYLAAIGHIRNALDQPAGEGQ